MKFLNISTNIIVIILHIMLKFKNEQLKEKKILIHYIIYLDRKQEGEREIFFFNIVCESIFEILKTFQNIPECTYWIE